MQNYRFLDPSPAALAADPDGTRPQIGKEVYPWRDLPVLKSIQIDAVLQPDGTYSPKFETIQNSAYKWSKKLKRNFRAINHGNGTYELCRLPDDVGIEPVQAAPVNFFPDTPAIGQAGAEAMPLSPWAAKAREKEEENK